MGAIHLDNLELSPAFGTSQGVPLTCLNHLSPHLSRERSICEPQRSLPVLPAPHPEAAALWRLCPRHIGAVLGPLGPAGVSFCSSKRG